MYKIVYWNTIKNIMADNLTKKQRKNCMSRIRSKWTKQEKMVHNYLKGHKVKHIMHPNLEGSPDIFLKKSDTVVFLNGCFWHRCQICFKEPKSNKKYWIPKIQKNVIRDQRNKKKLKDKGYKVITIWEHQVKKEISRVIDRLEKQ